MEYPFSRSRRSRDGLSRINACGDCAPYGHRFGVCKARRGNRKPHPQGANRVSGERVGWGEVTESVDFEELVQNLEDDPIRRELAAVQNDRVYAQGTRWQGPLMNLFQLEMTAKQLYPEEFGAWPGYENGATYPEFSPDEQLFDHQRIEDIVTGNF